MARQIQIIVWLGFTTGILGIFCLILPNPKQKDDNAHVYMLNVGQGDSFLIQAANGRQMLIDGGRDAAVLTELAKMMPSEDRSIDVVVATHPDSDHIGGLPLVLARYKVGLFLTSQVYTDTKTFTELFSQLSKNNVPSYFARRGMSVSLDTNNPAIFSILFPDRETSNWKTNEASVVGRLQIGPINEGTSILFTGDSPTSIEHFLAQAIPEKLDVDVLKLGHHGSKTSSSLEYLKTTSPSLALISAGIDNSYGHPHQEVLDRLKSLNIPWAATSQKGTVDVLKSLTFR